MRSVHLTRGRPTGGDQPFSVDDAWVDVGASSRAQAESLGLLLLSPVALTKRPIRYGENDASLAAPSAGRRAACAALVAAASGSPKVQGTVVVAFAVQLLQAGRPGLQALGALHGPFAYVHEVTIPTTFDETTVETVSLDSVNAQVAALRAWMGPTLGFDLDPDSRFVSQSVAPKPEPLNQQDRRGGKRYPHAHRVVWCIGLGRTGARRRLEAPALVGEAGDRTAGNLWVKVGTGDPLVVVRGAPGRDRLPHRLDPRRRLARGQPARWVLPFPL